MCCRLQRLRILERRKKATGAGDKRYEMDLVNQLMNLKYLNSNSRKCPSCGMATIKNEGCNKMTCVYCGSNWCWKCQQVCRRGNTFVRGLYRLLVGLTHEADA